MTGEITGASFENVGGVVPGGNGSQEATPHAPESDLLEVTNQELQDTLKDLISTYTSDSKEGQRKKGKIRGAVIPVAAGLLGTGIHWFANSALGKTLKLAQEYDVVIDSDTASQTMGAAQVLEALDPIGIASIAAGVASASASAFRRAFGESLFSYYARYAHFESKALHPTKKILTKLFNWYARGLEHTAFNNLVTNPAKQSATTRRLVEVARDTTKMEHLTEKQKIHLLSKGSFHILSGEAAKFFGAEFSKEELVAIEQISEELKASMNAMLATVPASERQRVLEAVQKKVVGDEKIRYWMSVGIMSSISGAKAFGLGKLFAGILQLIPPVINLTTQAGVSPHELSVSQAVPAVQEVPATQTLSSEVAAWLGHGALPNNVLTENPDLVQGIGEIATASPEVVPEPLFQSFARVREIFQGAPPVPEVVPTPPQYSWELLGEIPRQEAVVPVTPVVDALVTQSPMELPEPATVTFGFDVGVLPEIQKSDILVDTIQSSIESTITIDEAVEILSQISTHNPEQFMEAISQAQQDPAFVETFIPLAPVGASAPEIIAAIQSAGPSALYVLNKLLQLAACAGSLTTGGGACPRLAGP